MGQYYVIANIDKKEYFSASDFGYGVKLMEWSYDENECVSAMLSLMADKWKGDRVYVVGDYAECDNVDDAFYSTLDKVETELGFKGKKTIYQHPEIGSISEYNITLYDYVCNNFTHIEKFPEYKYIRYVYNTATQEFIDLKHANIAWGSGIKMDEKPKVNIVQYAQLPLLLAMGNGRGGGDYRSEDTYTEELVGSWCQYSQDLVLSPTYVEDYWKYVEFQPNFHESDKIIPYTDRHTVYETLKKECIRQMDSDIPQSEIYAYLDTLQDIEKYKNLQPDNRIRF